MKYVEIFNFSLLNVLTRSISLDIVTVRPQGEIFEN